MRKVQREICGISMDHQGCLVVAGNVFDVGNVSSLRKTCESKMGMRICIMHFASSLLRIFLATLSFQNFCMEYYLCYLDAVFTILQRIQFSTKKIYSTIAQDQYFFQKIKSNGRWSAEKLTVKFYLAPGVRNGKFYLAPGMRNGKIYLAPNYSFKKFYLAVRGLILQFI